MKAAFHTLGCKTNHYETDAIAQRFAQAGFERVAFDDVADVYIINTCTVTGEADRKSRQMLRRAKRRAPHAVVVAMGCHAQLSNAKDYADIVIGTQGKARALELVQDYLGLAGQANPAQLAAPAEVAGDIPQEDLFEELGIVDQQSECRAHIKIEDGCNSFCSYCAIPLARGRIRSREERAILAEAQALAAAGYREIVLTGIHVCSYGQERGEGSHAVVALAAQLAQIRGIERIRLGSLEPLSITPAFIELARTNPKSWNFMFTNTWRYEKQNVFFTLFLGYLAFCALEYFWDNQKMQLVCVLALLTVSVFLKADYGWRGFVFLLIMYWFRNDKTAQAIIGSCWLYYEWKACFAFLSINMYNGERGFVKGKFLKYVFYWFYPVHIIILVILRKLLFHM